MAMTGPDGATLANFSQWRFDRQILIDVMNDVQPGESIHDTAGAFCGAVAAMDGIHGVMLLVRQGDGSLRWAGGGGACAAVDGEAGFLPVDVARRFLDAGGEGPWNVDMAPSTSSDFALELSQCLRVEGLSAAGVTPVRWGGNSIGALVLATGEAGGRDRMASRLEVIEQLGSFAGSLMGRQAIEHVHQDDIRREVLDVMHNNRFHPVFQPVIETTSGRIAGYEALTRFDDGCRPDVRVAQAHAVGLGPAFEAHLAATAVQIARGLPPDVWLGLNFSAEAILEGFATPVVTKANRAIVIEITEHAPIDSYPDVRHAITQGGDVLLSVDDAGAGFASLLHVLELDPDIVKLDIGLIRGIDADPARQALAAGMCHFAHNTGTTLIAEGVETEGEADTVRELGVELAQGYLFGRPEILVVSG